MPDDNPDIADDPEKETEKPIYDPGSAFGDNPKKLPSIPPEEEGSLGDEPMDIGDEPLSK